MLTMYQKANVALNASQVCSQNTCNTHTHTRARHTTRTHTYTHQFRLLSVHLLNQKQYETTCKHFLYLLTDLDKKTTSLNKAVVAIKVSNDNKQYAFDDDDPRRNWAHW